MDIRVKQVIDFYGYTTRSFEQKISVSDGTIRKFLVGKISLKVDTILKITANFPQISLDWLLLGRGDMLRKDEEKTQQNQNINQNYGNATYLSEPKSKYNQNNIAITAQQDTIKALQDTIKALQDTVEIQRELINELRK